MTDNNSLPNVLEERGWEQISEYPERYVGWYRGNGVKMRGGVKMSSDGTPLVYNRPDPWLPDLLVCRPELAETVLAAARAAA
jgi:hypothetical protein